VLIFMRYEGEAFFIGDEIKVTLLAVNQNQIRVGIDAPKEVPVHREEVYYRTSDGPTIEVRSDENTSSSNINEKDIKQELFGYSLEFSLPNGKRARINHNDKSRLLQAAQTLYEKNMA